MNILIAPDKFKGSLSARQAGQAIADGIRQVAPEAEVTILPVADGGEGSLSAIGSVLSLEFITVPVSDPLGRPIEARYGYREGEAFVEMALASGLELVEPELRNPLQTTSYGAGELIRHAVDHGAKVVHLFLGGSATNDGAMGIAAALGFTFLDRQGKPLPPIGASLLKVGQIIAPDPVFLQSFEIRCLVDVESPLLGERGASQMYAAQKGADRAMITLLEQGLAHFATTIRTQFQRDVTKLVGGGAAGGIPAGLFGLLQAEITPGLETIFSLLQFEEQVKKADWVISGEGSIDRQSLEGKVISGVLRYADQWSKPAFLFAGRRLVRAADLESKGLRGIAAVMDVAPNEQAAIRDAAKYLTQLAEQVFRAELKR